MKDDEWSLVEFTPKDSKELWLFRKNLSSIVKKKRENYDSIIFLTFYYTPAPNGFSTSKDNDVFESLEKNDFMKLEMNTSSLLVGVVTKPGLKDFLFYSSEPELFLDKAYYLINKYKQFNIECEYSDDPDWSQYDDLPD